MSTIHVVEHMQIYRLTVLLRSIVLDAVCRW